MHVCACVRVCVCACVRVCVNLSSDGETTHEVNCWITKVSKAFGSLRISIFSNHNLSVHTKRTFYNVVVISILLYGAETWTLKAPDMCSVG